MECASANFCSAEKDLYLMINGKEEGCKEFVVHEDR